MENSPNPQLDDMSTSDFFMGSTIMIVSAILYAVGLNIQRASMTINAAEGAAYGCRGPCAARYPTLWWLVGLLIYAIGGLGLGTLAFSYLSVALCSSLFTSTLVFNAILARLWLGEVVTLYDAVMYALIIVGVSVTAASLPRETEILKIHESSLLYGDTSAVICWVVMGVLLVSLHILIHSLEKQYDDPTHHYAQQPKRVYFVAMFSYPFVLGTFEGFAYVCLKTFNNWWHHWSSGDKTQIQHFFFWIGVAITPLLVFLVLYWLKKSYTRFHITQIFPVELAALTIFSVMGGLFVHDEALLMSGRDTIWVTLGLVILVAAMIVVALLKSAQQEGYGNRVVPARFDDVNLPAPAVVGDLPVGSPPAPSGLVVASAAAPDKLGAPGAPETDSDDSVTAVSN